MRNLTFAVVLLIILGIFIVFRWKPSPIGGRERSEHNGATNYPTAPVVPVVNPSDPVRTRSKVRTDDPKGTVEKTTALLRNTKVGRQERLTFPEQSVTDRITTFERIVREAGIESREIRIAFDHQNALFETKVGQLDLSNLPLRDVILYICDGAKLWFRIGPGIVEFYDPATEPKLDPPSEQ